MKGKRMNMYDKSLVVIFSFYLAFVAILNIMTPDRRFSEFENRYLAGKPEFSFQNLVKGNYGIEFENYINEQFALRDLWVSLKAGTERIFGKKENNGVYFGRDGFLLEKFDKVDLEQLDKNIASVKEFAGKSKVNIYFLLIPTSTEILQNKLPPYAPFESQKKIIDYAYGKLYDNVKPVNIYSQLERQKENYIYYRSDHHWTTEGAYIGYEQLMKAMGTEPLEKNFFKVEKASRDFYGTLYSKSAARWIKPDEINLYTPVEDTVFEVNIIDAEKTMDSLYERSHLNRKDKYSVFLDGNHALTIVKNITSKSQSKLLVLKDSFAHSLVPFIANNFSEVHMADLRYFKTDFNGYCSQNDIDTIVFIYSVPNFCSDNNLIWLNAC